MGIGKTYVSPNKERKKQQKKEKQSRVNARETEFLPRCFDFRGEKNPPIIQLMLVEKMRAAENEYDTP